MITIFFLFLPPTRLGPVPPNATVVFEVEVFSVSRGPRTMQAFGHIDVDKDRSLTKAEVIRFYKLITITEGLDRKDSFNACLQQH